MQFEQLTDEQLRDAEREIGARKQERECAKWDAELVGRYFRVIRVKDRSSMDVFFRPSTALSSDDYVTLDESLAVGADANTYVYADVVYLHIKSRNERELTCSGFQVSHGNRKEPYLKVQPVFYSYDDFRRYLNSWSIHTGPTKHVDEIPKNEYDTALRKAVANFTGLDL